VDASRSLSRSSVVANAPDSSDSDDDDLSFTEDVYVAALSYDNCVSERI
jgi:hypothetical protein